MSTILSIDPGTRHTGYAILEGEELKKYGCIEPKSSLELGDRLMTISKYIKDLIRAHNPTTIICEDQYGGKNTKTLMALREVTGVARLAAAEFNIDFYLIQATSIKKSVTGDGRASKDKVRNAINEKYQLQITNDNISDAIAAGVAHTNS